MADSKTPDAGTWKPGMQHTLTAAAAAVDPDMDGEIDGSSAPPVTIADVLAVAYDAWSPVLKGLIPKAVSIPLPADFVTYLHSDGVILPAVPAGVTVSPLDPRSNHRQAPMEEDVDDEADVAVEGGGAGAAAEDDGKDTETGPSFPELEAAILSAIEEFGAVFPKLNWTSAQDAAWVADLKCVTPGQVYLLLKSSDLLVYDLDHAFTKCIDFDEGAPPKVQPQLVLKKWCNLAPSREFRCFVYRGQLVAISQRHVRSYYEHMLGEKDAMRDVITEFFSSKLSQRQLPENYVADVFVDKNHRVWVVDLNVFGGDTEPLLFEWTELLEARTPVPMRIIEENIGVRFAPHAHHQLPQDLLDAGSSDVLLEQLMKLTRDQAAESDSDEEEV